MRYFISLLVLILVLILHVKGIHGLYHKIPLYDVYMHILGGIGIALFVSALINSRILRPKSVFWGVVLGTLAIGFFWEFFEIYYNIAKYPLWTKLYYLDTLKDLVDDVVGGMLVAFLSALYNAKKQKQQQNTKGSL
jgi:hypothetical protein